MADGRMPVLVVPGEWLSTLRAKKNISAKLKLKVRLRPVEAVGFIGAATAKQKEYVGGTFHVSILCSYSARRADLFAR